MWSIIGKRLVKCVETETFTQKLGTKSGSTVGPCCRAAIIYKLSD